MYPIPAISQKSVLWCHLSSRYGTRSTPRTHPLPGDTRRQDCKPGTCWNIDRDAWNAVWEFENIQQSFLYFHFLFFTFLLVLVPSPPSLQVCELTMLLTACISPSVTRVSSSTFVLPDSSQLLFSFSILKACFFFFSFFPFHYAQRKENRAYSCRVRKEPFSQWHASVFTSSQRKSGYMPRPGWKTSVNALNTWWKIS